MYGTPLELVTHFKYLENRPHSWWKYAHSSWEMAENLRLAIARVYRTSSSKGITHRKHAMLWLFQVFALTAGLYGCQIWATFSLTWFLSNHPCTRGFSEKTPGCQERYWYSLRAPGNRPDAYLFLLVQMHHKILEQFIYSLQTTLFLRNLCGMIHFLQTEVLHGLTRFCMHSKTYLHLNSFWMPYDLVRLSI